MTPDEQRLELMTGGCPECGHAVLNHRKGVCHCGCKAIPPPNFVPHPKQLEFLNQEDEVLWPGAGGYPR